MTTIYVNGIKTTEEELEKIEITSEEVKKILAEGIVMKNERDHNTDVRVSV